MINILIISAIVITAAFTLLRIFRKPLRKWVNALYMKFKIATLRTAIGEADEDKKVTGRKNMVVYDTDTGAFAPVQKKVLKKAANATKSKNNAAMTDGRKKMAAKKQQEKKQKSLKRERTFTPATNRKTEEKSLYVTR
jgi:hypothetical protein